MTVDAVTGDSNQALCDASQLGVIDLDLAHLPCDAQYNALSTHAELALMVHPGACRMISSQPQVSIRRVTAAQPDGGTFRLVDRRGEAGGTLRIWMHLGG